MEGKSRILVLLAVCLLMAWTTLAQAAVIYVKTGGNDGNNGSSWTLAKATINSALGIASNGDEVWVAVGTYDNSSYGATVPSGVKLLGGFLGTESLQTDRDWAANITTISGGVISVTGTASAAAALDGFKIMNPNATHLACGIALTGNVTFSHNIVTGSNVGRSTLISCSGPVRFANNLICEFSGDEMILVYCESNQGDPILTNNTISNNDNTEGTAVYCSQYARLSNNIICNNPAVGIAGGEDVVLINNCIYGNALNDYVYFPMEWTPPSTEINADPLFVAAGNGDYHLTSSSPCIDAGNDNEVDQDCLDLDAKIRQVDTVSGDSKVDMGTYEYPDLTAPNAPVVTDDGTYTEQSDELHASWSATDSESGIIEYQYAIGTTSGDTDVVGWTSTGTTASVYHTGLSLMSGQTYYFSVKAKNACGYWSSAGNSDGITVDTTSPSTPVVTDDGTYTTSTTMLHATWTSADTGSGIVEYQYAIGTSPTGYGTGAVTGWTSTATQTGVTRIIQRLIGGSPYYFYVKAKNAAGLWSDVGISNGIELQPTTEKLDLLLGLGDFEECHYSRDLNLDEFGIIPTADFTVSDGWTAAYNLDHPYIYKIVESGSFTDDGYIYMDSGKSYQYFGVNNNSGHSVSSQFYIPVKSNTKYPDISFYPGDKFVFHIDKVISSHFEPNHQGASIGMFYMVAGDSTQYYQSQDIDLSVGYANNVELTLDVANLTYVRPFLQLYIANNNLTSDLTGILLSGARLHAIRDNTDVLDYEETPYVKNRSIQTFTVGWNKSLPERAAARYYDYISPTMAYENPSFSILRELNPEIKIYIYQGGMDACDHSRAARWGVTPFKMDYVVANHPTWLWRQTQTIPPIANDPGVFNNDPYDYLNYYCNAAGISNRYWISAVTDPTYQTEWADAVIDLAEATGADGVWIDTCGMLSAARDGYNRDIWETQKFLHAVIPLLRTAGLTTIVNNAQQNLDGQVGWNGDIAEIYFNPNWEPTVVYTENQGYSQNTSENTPDVFFREYSFIGCNFGYSQSYWSRCINDAKLVSNWNGNLSSSEAKRIQYYVVQCDTTEHPAYDEEGKAGWIPFALASFLLCNNDYISLGIDICDVNGNTSDAMVDYSITKRLGVTDGDDEPINSDQYFRERYYTADGSGSYGGVVVVNANTSDRTYTVPFDAVDDSGVLHTQGSNITFLPNMGKILIAVVPR